MGQLIDKDSELNGTDKNERVEAGFKPATYRKTQVWCRCFNRLSHTLAR